MLLAALCNRVLVLEKYASIIEEWNSGRPGISNVAHLRMDSKGDWSAFRQSPIQLAVIDAEHTAYAVRREIAKLLTLPIRPHVIVLHDFCFPGVFVAVREAESAGLMTCSEIGMLNWCDGIPLTEKGHREGAFCTVVSGGRKRHAAGVLDDFDRTVDEIIFRDSKWQLAHLQTALFTGFVLALKDGMFSLASVSSSDFTLTSEVHGIAALRHDVHSGGARARLDISHPVEKVGQHMEVFFSPSLESITVDMSHCDFFGGSAMLGLQHDTAQAVVSIQDLDAAVAHPRWSNGTTG
mmetsp:Transcript_108790/g.249546  ORF Transcript_108790/g.249546 Transcript_108790/m.249546 type:complete len:294 (+) Transcript_108790:266-1147(+)